LSERCLAVAVQCVTAQIQVTCPEGVVVHTVVVVTGGGTVVGGTYTVVVGAAGGTVTGVVAVVREGAAVVGGGVATDCCEFEGLVGVGVDDWVRATLVVGEACAALRGGVTTEVVVPVVP
jgi:hypothetical protein